jgi:Mg2+ and Co2+ transporter CorA
MYLSLLYTIVMSVQTDTSDRIDELEKRVKSIEKVLDDKADILHPNFKGYYKLTEEEIKELNQISDEIDEGKYSTYDEVFPNLE